MIIAIVKNDYIKHDFINRLSQTKKWKSELVDILMIEFCRTYIFDRWNSFRVQQ
jgi:hypothetical protein